MILRPETAVLAYWSSASGNTKDFVGRLDLPSKSIADEGPDLVMPEHFVLITPTFAAGDGRGAVPKPVIRFLNQRENRDRILGVIGCGNRNFGEMFCIGARVAAEKCGVPLLYRVELRGTDKDVAVVNQGVRLLIASALQPRTAAPFGLAKNSPMTP